MDSEVLQIQEKEAVYKRDILTLEQQVKQWKEACITKISELSDDCYKAFNDLQMGLASTKDETVRDKYQLMCYKDTYEFLEFIENKAYTDLCLFLLNNSSYFARLVSHYDKYCQKMEMQYSIELVSEKEWKDNEKAISLMKKYLAK